MNRIVFKQTKKLNKFHLNKGICYLKLRGSIYFLKGTKNESINFLRGVVDYQKKTPIEFYKEINEDFDRKTNAVKQTREKKKTYYNHIKIERLNRKVDKLLKEIEQTKEELKKQESISNITTIK